MTEFTTEELVKWIGVVERYHSVDDEIEMCQTIKRRLTKKVTIEWAEGVIETIIGHMNDPQSGLNVLRSRDDLLKAVKELGIEMGDPHSKSEENRHRG